MKTKWFWLVITLIMGMVFSLACNKDDDKDDDSPTGAGGAQGNITITVSNGLTPTISWDGGKVYNVTVTDTAIAQSDPVNAMYYSIADPTGDGISSPVSYGSTPTGAILTANKPLVSGKKYQVSVTRKNGDFGYKEISR